VKVSEMFDRVLVRSGQYIIKPKYIELDVDRFRVLVEDACALYSKSRPFDRDYDINFRGNLQYTFTDTFDLELKRVPNWISEVKPTNLGRFYDSPYNSSSVSETIELPWVYEKPVLTVPYYSMFRVKAVYKHIVESVPVENNTPEYEVKTITVEDDMFFKILQAYFLQGLGRSRRAFTHNDLPITMDADTLAGEAETMLNDIKEEIQNVQKFHLAIG
jgi:hypothetical protein